ncbi:MAG: hypothetical protein JXB13_10915 [Phycisphaerae bacterium]|nr:hypothetical protein [Phycisphaerae bacterium]
MLSLAAIAAVPPSVLNAERAVIDRRCVLRAGFVDQPGDHKQRDDPTPLGGRIAIA